MSFFEARDIAVRDGATPLLSPLSLHLEPGVPLIVLGETGSGKSLLTQAIMGTLPPELSAGGQVSVGGRVLDAADRRAFQGLWGREIAVLPQEPWLSLDPTMRARGQIAEAYRLVRALRPAAARAQAEADLAALGLSKSGALYPYQLSGGMAQRVAIAAARAGGARIVIADEPTKGLDAARRDEVADLLLSEMGDDGGLLVITHALSLARRIGGRLMVLRAGEVVEIGATAEVFAAPRASYTRDLLDADPASWPPRRRDVPGGTGVVAAEGLTVVRGGRTLFRDVTFGIAPGAIHGVTGPSGAASPPSVMRSSACSCRRKATSRDSPACRPHRVRSSTKTRWRPSFANARLETSSATWRCVRTSRRTGRRSCWSASGSIPIFWADGQARFRAATCSASPCCGSCSCARLSSSPMSRPRASTRSLRLR